MKAVKLQMADGSQCLAIPGIGIVVPGRDQSGRVLVGQSVLLFPGMPPMPIKETIDSLEESFNSSNSLKVVY